MDEKKQKKIQAINAQRLPDAFELVRNQDCFMTEQTMIEGLERILGAKCEVFAKMLYMRASGLREKSKLQFRDFTKLFIPFWVSSPLLCLSFNLILSLCRMIKRRQLTNMYSNCWMSKVKAN